MRLPMVYKSTVETPHPEKDQTRPFHLFSHIIIITMTVLSRFSNKVVIITGSFHLLIMNDTGLWDAMNIVDHGQETTKQKQRIHHYLHFSHSSISPFQSGGGSGIGQAVVRRVVAEGGIVIAVDVNEDGLKAGTKQTEKIAAADGRYSFMVGSVSDEETVKKIVQDVVDQEGRLDVLINVAGILRSSKLTETTLERKIELPFFFLVPSSMVVKLCFSLTLPLRFLCDQT